MGGQLYYHGDRGGVWGNRGADIYQILTWIPHFAKLERVDGKEMPMKLEVLGEISRYVEMDRESLLERGVEALLRERKRSVMLERHQILFRYHVSKAAELEGKIQSGDIEEHPAWEDLITLENLEDAIHKLDGYLRDLQKTA